LRLSNYNYDATVLLARVQKLFARDDLLLGGVLQRSVLLRSTGPVLHVMSRIEVLPKSVAAPSPLVRDYGTVVFVAELLGRESLVDRLSHLVEKRFEVGKYTVNSTGLGFYDRLEPSSNSYSEWPCTVFDITFGSAQLSYEPLIHPTLKSFSTTYDAIQSEALLRTCQVEGSVVA
jgi:hypothetical protein